MFDFDLITMGRSGLDLYAEQIGAPFEEIRSFAAYVGGTPANIAVGSRRLGMRSAILTAVGEDPVGDFILQFLQEEGVDVRFVPRKPGTRSGMVLLGIVPPDDFPRVHYRDNAADLEITIDDVLALPLAKTRALLVVGTNLSKSPSREATLFAAEEARRVGAKVVVDLDHRPDLWHDERAYAVSISGLLPFCHIVIGTQEEIAAAGKNSEIMAAIGTLLRLGPEVLVEKRGAEGSRVHLNDGSMIEARGFRIEVQNTLGAGDAFAAGFLYGYLNDRGWHGAARLGNACGAIVVTRHACSASCPRLDEVMSFVDARGGF